jgi:6-phosphogluconolactonase
VTFEAFQGRDALADAATGLLAGELRQPGPQNLIVTGGSSPGPVYDRLSALDLGWERITVTLSDERWVGPTSPASNETLVRTRLMKGRAAAARFAPLKDDSASPRDNAAALEPAIIALAPFAATLLGMGEDGHIGSLFPGKAAAEDLDPNGARWVVGVPVAGLAPFVPRVSLTLRALLAARLVVVLITGEAKRAVVERVMAEAAYSPPVASLLRQGRVPVRVLWAP